MYKLFSLILTVVDCGALTNPANGKVIHTQSGGTTYGQTATYSCNTGYNLVGNSTRNCQATGLWSGSAPICQGGLFVHACTQWGQMSGSFYLSEQIRRDSILSTWLINTT